MKYIVFPLLFVCSSLAAGTSETRLDTLEAKVKSLVEYSMKLENKITDLERNTVRCDSDVFIRSGDKNYWLVTLNEKDPVDWRAEAVPTDWLGKVPWNYKRKWIILCR